MSPAGQRLWSGIAAATRQVRRDGILSALAVAGAVIPLALLVAWALGAAPAWLAPSPIPLALLACALAAVVVIGWWGVRRWVRGVDDLLVAGATETRRGMPAGSVRGVLELSRALPAGTSPALYSRAELELARQLAGIAPRELSGPIGESARRRRRGALLAFGALVVATVTLGFISPERSRAGWGALLHPVAHLTPPPLPPLGVSPGSVEVPRGEPLDIAIEAPSRRQVTVRWRAEGDVSRQLRVAVQAGRATARIERIDAPLIYWVVAPDGAVSDTFRVTPLDPLLFSDLVVDVVYPSYLGRTAERFEDDVPPLTVPAGTELRIRGRATRRLRDAALMRADGASRVPLEVTADRFSGRWTPRATGVYEWSLTDETGGAAATAPSPLELTIVPDEAPRVEITYPSADTLLGPTLRQAIVADASDDHGLRTAELVSWRVSALGAVEEPVTQRLTLEGDPDRAIIRGMLDANDRRLLPGDALHYFVRVVDGSPPGQEGVSATHVLRLPGTEELRRQAEREAESMVEDAASLTRDAEQLETETRNLARQSARSSAGSNGRTGRNGGAGGQSGGGGELGYEEREQARQILDQQQEMLDRVAQMRERTEALERALEAAGLEDPALQQRLRELRELYDQMLTPELQEQLDRLRDSIDEMDPEEVRRSLERLAQQQEEFQQQLDQSLELLRRAALEQRMNAAARDARELAAQQQALSEAMRNEPTPSPERVQQQREMADRASSLQELLAALQQQLGQQGETATAQQAGQAGEQVQQAQQGMQQAARQAEQGQGQQSARTGEQAAEQLEAVAESLDSARESMAEGWRDEVQEAMSRAAGDALELARRQQELLEEMEQAQDGQQGQQGEQAEGRQQSQDGQQAGQQGQQGDQSGKQGQQGQQGQGQKGQQGSQGKQGQQGSGQQGQQGGKQGGQQGQQGQGQQGQGQQGQQGQGEQNRQGTGSGQGVQQQAGGPPGSGGPDRERLQSEQAALQQSLQALGRNVAEAGRRSAMVDRDVSAALSRAMLSTQQTLEALQRQDGRQGMPVEQAREAVDALNRLALELLENGDRVEQAQSGTGLQQALEQLAELAKQQGSLNGQASSLLPLDLGPRAMAEQMQRMARQQRDVAKKLGGMNDMTGGQDDVLGRLDELAREAESIARELSGGRLDAQLLERQERLFHRLLDAGRTLEREEYTSERVAERPGHFEVSRAAALDAELVESGPRYPVPDAEVLRSLSPAFRRLILDYFDRLNRGAAAATSPSDRGGDGAPEGTRDR